MFLQGWPRRFAEHTLRLASLFCLVLLGVALLSTSRLPEEKFSLLYSMPLYSAFFAWLFCRLRESARFTIASIILDLAVVGLSASRLFSAAIPSSGHALFLSYSLTTVSNRLYQVAAAAMLAATVAVKLYWGDHRSWVYGILAGAMFGVAHRRVVLKLVAKSEPVR